ncbi:MAG: ATP-binding protein [Candidatus Methylomirabilia bacterium]
MEIKADGAGVPGNLARQTILVIDDDRGYAGLVAEILEMAGLAAQATHSGEEGLAAARRHRPDLILLDVQMPGIDGYETCRRLKADVATAEIPVLFMSGQADIEDKLQGFAAGGLDYIPKPFQRLELLARVRTHLKLQDQARLLQAQTFELGKAHDVLEQRVQERTADLKKSQSELTVKIQELSALNAIAQIIATTSELGGMLQGVLETTLSLAFLEVQKKGVVFLIDEKDPSRLNRVAHVGLLQTLVDTEQQIEVGHCLCGASADTGKNIITTESSVATHPVQYRGMPNHGHVVLPIKSREAVLGVMTMYLEPGVHPSAAEVRLLEAIASQVGLAVENRRLFRDIVTGKQEWEKTFDAIADLVTINAPDHTVLRLNAAAARVFGGYQGSLGRKFYELLGDERFAECCKLAPDIGSTPGTATIRGREYDTSVYPLEEQGQPRGCVFVAKDVTERNLAARSLREQRTFTDNLLQSSSAATFVIDTRHEVITWNKACEELTGFPAAAMIGTAGQWRPFYAQRRPVLADIVLDGYSEKDAGLYDKVSRSVLATEGLRAEGWYHNLNGKDRYIVFDAAPIRGGDGTVIAAIETLQDISGRKRAEEEVAASTARYSGQLTALNAASNTLMVTANLREIYQKICDIVIAVFDLKLCWLGLVEAGTHDVRPVAHAGIEDGYLSTIQVRWDDSSLGNGPTGTAIKTRASSGSSVADPRSGPWRAEAETRGYLASLAVPLLYSGDRCVGVLNFYSDQADYFTSDRVKLCQIFANQAAVAIENARLIEGLEETVLERTGEIQNVNRELSALNRELELRRQEAEAANRTKSDFLANMSHELRTPLNAIIGFSDLMLRGMAGPLAGDQKEYLGDIFSSGRHLLSLINDILDLSKVEAGKMELEPAAFDLTDLVVSSLSMFREKALKHGIRLEAQTAAGAAPVYGDERKIKQILFNLLSNALKFTPDGGSVSVRTAVVTGSGDDHVEIAVADTGIGMTPEEQEQLFQPFKQLGHHLTKRHEGTGLGLALCRKFVELHNGSITVESAPGRGSTFTVRLPLGTDLLAPRGQI